MSHIYSTNKIVFRVTMRDAFWDIRNSSFPEFPPVNEESKRENAGYYLADQVTGTGLQQPCREIAIDAVAPMIFRQELAEAGVAESLWPDTDDVELFRKLFRIEQFPLTADFGESPVVNTST